MTEDREKPREGCEESPVLSDKGEGAEECPENLCVRLAPLAEH